MTLGIRTSAKKTNQFTREFISKLDAVLPNVLEERRRRVGNNLGEIRKPAVGFHLPYVGLRCKNFLSNRKSYKKEVVKLSKNIEEMPNCTTLFT